MATSTWTRAASLSPVRRRAALISGIGLLCMAVLAGWANFAVIERLVTRGDPVETARAFTDNAGLFHLGVIAFAMVAFLDCLVAWSLWVYFASVDRRVSAAAAWVRILYAVILAAAIAFLANGDGERFYLLWEPGLALFGVHLMLVSWLSWRSDFVPRWIAVLLAIAGFGYMYDGVQSLGLFNSGFKLAAYTFMGEVMLMGWLLATSIRRFLFRTASSELSV